MECNLKKIAQIINGKLIGSNIIFSEKPLLAFDTRKIRIPEETIFLAIDGPFRSGTEFLRDAIEKKVKSFVFPKREENNIYKNYSNNDLGFIIVENVIQALHQLVIYHRIKFDCTTIIGITGSNGKTIVKEWIANSLSNFQESVCKSPLSYNSQIGVPLSVWNLEAGIKYGIFEAGISKSGEMELLQKIIQPHVGIFTNLGSAHSLNFSSDKEKLEEKLILFKDSKSLVFRNDGLWWSYEIQAFCRKHNVEMWDWGLKASRLRIIEIKKRDHETQIIFSNKNKLIIPFTDDGSVENAIHVAVALYLLGYDEGKVRNEIKRLSSVDMRLKVIPGIRNTLLINDTYSSDPESFLVALEKLNEISEGYQKTLVITDFDQIKSQELFWKKILKELPRFGKIYRLVAIGPILNDIFKNTEQKNIITIIKTEDLIKILPEINFKDEAILFKGARKYRLENVIQQLSKRTHHSWLEISLDALYHNLMQYKTFLGSNIKIMVMLKASAYGSGEDMALAMNFLPLDYIAVAYLDEAIALRKNAIKYPIMVMNVPPELLELVIDYNVEPVIHNWDILNTYHAQLNLLGYSGLPIHIEIDTGMHRLGFSYKEVYTLAEFLRNNNKLFHVKTIFSHFSGADEISMEGFTQLQIDRFNLSRSVFKKFLGSDIKFHICNSAGAIRYPEAKYDMVRLGIGFYGYVSDKKNLDLKSSLNWKTTIISIKEVPAGEPVGYGNDAIYNNNRRIAVLPIGYADGFDRKLGNGRWFVKHKFGYIPTIGRICMDMMMIDVTGLNVTIGDEIEIFHEGFEPEEMAEKTGTIPYEILTRISPRIKRILVKE